ncbi:MAG TPA: hypothetical protein VHZ49_11920 [Methylomirabilota bacterium]|nr:hypothetical protein [Methylomirabilota bacterium]
MADGAIVPIAMIRGRMHNPLVAFVPSAMNRILLWLGILGLTACVVAAPRQTQAGPSTSDNLLELAAKGGPALGLGLGVSPLRPERTAPLAGVAPSLESRLLLDGDQAGRALSFDVKLRWPTADLPIEPYLVLGPALIVDQPHELSSLVGIQADPVLRLGAKAGAGFNWRLTKDTTLFGSYDVTTTTADGLSFPGGRAPGAGSAPAHDVLYGVRFRY